ncbi:MAG: hypothetical protein MI922_04485, partial [Bacteroidales bacterium]|nr:hypothetical protein [Bacteroidales bacterium]
MKKILVTLITILTIVQTVRSQEFIFALKEEIQNNQFDSVKVSNDTLIGYKANGILQTIPMDKISAIKFRDNYCQVIQFNYSIDTIECTVHSISNSEIEYFDSFGNLTTVKNSKVLAVAFNTDN